MGLRSWWKSHWVKEVQPTKPWPPPPEAKVRYYDMATPAKEPLDWGPPKESPTVKTWVYWRIARDGTPTVSTCDDPMGHPHAHLIAIPIPEDVQKCIAATKNPPLCMVLQKNGRHVGDCREEST